MPHLRSGLSRSRQETDALLATLEARIPELLAEYPEDGDFFNAFAGEAEVITESATTDAQYISGRIDCMLAKFDLIPGDGCDPNCAPAE